jgi:hypothetical protein
VGASPTGACRFAFVTSLFASPRRRRPQRRAIRNNASGNKADQRRKIEELMAVIGRADR